MKAALTSLYSRYFGTLRSECWLGSRSVGELCLGEVGRSLLLPRAKVYQGKGRQQIKGRRYISGKVLGSYVVTEAQGRDVIKACKIQKPDDAER